jgi:hypothetical protein
MTTPGFEYKKKKGETPFETFLRYTDEKEQSATKLAAIIEQHVGEGSQLLDIVSATENTWGRRWRGCRRRDG